MGMNKKEIDEARKILEHLLLKCKCAYRPNYRMIRRGYKRICWALLKEERAFRKVRR